MLPLLKKELIIQFFSNYVTWSFNERSLGQCYRRIEDVDLKHEEFVHHFLQQIWLFGARLDSATKTIMNIGGIMVLLRTFCASGKGFSLDHFTQVVRKLDFFTEFEK
jgi:ABC-type sulfate transport system substrate-binding protein